MKGLRLSIPTRIFIAFSAILIGFVAVAALSLVQNERSATTLQLLQEGYLPLALNVGEARGTQSGLSMVLERVFEERAAAKNWLGLARGFRLGRLRRSMEITSRMEQLELSAQEREDLAKVRRDLERVEEAIGSSEKKLDELLRVLEAREEPDDGQLLHQAQGEEQRVERRLRHAWSSIQQQVAATSARAAEQTQESALQLGVLAFVGVLLGLGAMFWLRHLLAPLPRLEARVAAVARGELAPNQVRVSDDELGRLASEFERMVEALRTRDANLVEAREKLLQNERLAAIGRMAAHVTHEVRNPLSSIGLNVELLEDEVERSSPEAKQLLRAIRTEVDRLTGITEEYLRLARLPAPRAELEDFRQVVDSIARFIRPEVESKGCALHLDLPSGELPRVAMDENQLRQAVLNLVRNAQEAHAKTITLAVRLHDRSVELQVRDDGEGMSEEARGRLFEPFFTTKGEGTGLGLSLTQQIVAAHDGTIRCEKAEVRGTVFRLMFPASP